MSQEIRCVNCNTVLASLRSRTMIIKPVDPEIPEFHLSERDKDETTSPPTYNPKELICPSCGAVNKIY